MTGILNLLSLVLGAFAVALMPPAIVALLAGEGEAAYQFLLTCGLTGFVAGGLFFAFQGRRGRITRLHSFVLAIAAWIVPSFIAAVPLAQLGGLDYGAALFEAVSGYTTTGATVIPDLGALPLSVVFWRAELQWIGGLMTLLLIVLVLAPAGLGGLPARHIALVEGPQDSGGRRLLDVSRGIFGAYAVVTMLCIVLLLLTGLPIFDAVCLAFATVSTGGFMPRPGTVGDYANPAAEMVLMVFMLLGATSILWQRMVLRGRWQLLREHREDYWVIGVAVAVGLAFAVVMANVPELDRLGALREGLFIGISAVTTTGFDGISVGFAGLPITVMMVLAIVGGGSFSTAGGIKFFRVGGMFVQAGRELKRLVYPHGVQPMRFGSQSYDMELMKAIWSHFIACILLIAFASLAVALFHASYEGALLATVSAFSNIGGLYAAPWAEGGEWPAYAELDPLAQLVLAFTMIAGRLEVIALLGSAGAIYWRT